MHDQVFSSMASHLRFKKERSLSQIVKHEQSAKTEAIRATNFLNAQHLDKAKEAAMTVIGHVGHVFGNVLIFPFLQGEEEQAKANKLRQQYIVSQSSKAHNQH